MHSVFAIDVRLQGKLTFSKLDKNRLLSHAMDMFRSLLTHPGFCIDVHGFFARSRQLFAR